MENLDKKKADELRALARDRGVPGADGMRKADLIAALKEPADRREVLFRRFAPGSVPVSDGRPAGYAPEPDPQEGEPEPRPAGKVGEPIGKHRGPREKFSRLVAAIDGELSGSERSALEALREAGWLVLVHGQVEDGYVNTARRSFRVRGRYDLCLARRKLRR